MNSFNDTVLSVVLSWARHELNSIVLHGVLHVGA